VMCLGSFIIFRIVLIILIVLISLLNIGEDTLNMLVATDEEIFGGYCTRFKFMCTFSW
jgi:hypothetical protein